MNIRIMQKLVLILTLIGTLSACATQWQKNEYGLQLKHARSSTLPKDQARSIQIQDLQAGDILFSAESSMVSLGVRLFNNAAVSHAFIYLGDGQIAEAVGTGVRIRPLQEALQESNLMAAFRYPDLNEEDVLQLRYFAEKQAGRHYNYLGIAKQSTYSITRNVCELPIMPRHIRRFCLNSMATILITPFAGQGFFCSQFVIEAFNAIDKPLTRTPAEWITPQDILHMREGDITTVKATAKLQYVGHLACKDSIWNNGCKRIA